MQSPEDLETLLLLRGQRGRSWTAEAVGHELGITREAAAAALDRLCSANFLDVRIGQTLVFRFTPGTPELERLADELVAFYGAHRVLVLNYLTARAIERTRTAAIDTFAQAFRIAPRKGDKDG